MNKKCITTFGLMVLAIATIPFEFLSINLGGFSLKLYQIIVLIMTGLFYMFFIIKKYKYKLPLLFMIGITCVSIIYSISFIPYQYVIEVGIQTILYLCMIICIILIINSREKLETTLKIYFYSGLIISVYSLIEFVGYRYLHLTFFKIWTGTRSDAFFSEANWLSAYAMTIFLLGLHYSYTYKNKKYYTYFLISILPLVLSQSRGAYIAIVISMLLMYFSRNKEIKKYFRFKNIVILFIILTIILFIMNDAILDLIMRSSSGEQSTSDFRYNMLIRAIDELPILNLFESMLGQGLGIFKWYKNGILRNSAWNIYISFFIENGWLFFIIFTGMCISIFYNLYRIINKDNMCLVIILNYTSMLIFALTSNLVFMGFFWFSFGISISYLNIYYREAKNENKYYNCNLQVR